MEIPPQAEETTNSLSEQTEISTHNSKRKSPLVPFKTEDIVDVIDSPFEDEETSRKRRQVLSETEPENTDTKKMKKVLNKRRSVRATVKKENTSVKKENTSIKSESATADLNFRRSTRVKIPVVKFSPMLNRNSVSETEDDSYDTPVEHDSKEEESSEDEVVDLLVDKRDDSQLSAFELQRKKNIEERMRLFQELKVDETKSQLEQLTHKLKKKPTSAVKFPAPKKSPVVRRKSLRLEGASAKSPRLEEDSRLNTLAKASRGNMYSFQMEWGNEPRKEEPELEMSKVLLSNFNVDDCKNLMKSWSENVTGLKKSDTNLKTCSLQAFNSRMRKMSLKEYNKIKVTRERIYSLAIHPTFNNGILVAAGSKNGAVGIWNADFEYKEWADLKLMTFDHHVRPTNCVSFGQFNPSLLYTTSYDGTSRRLDMNTQTFTLIHSTDPDIKDQHLTWHCELSPEVLLVAQGDGDVAKVDTREPKPTVFKCHKRSVRTLSLHPVTKQHIVTTSSATNIAAVWDIRQMNSKGDGMLSSVNFQRAVTSAFFSPVTGNRLLTSSYDDNISVFSLAELSQPVLECKTNHNNQTGRFTTNFKAQWHPQREDVFIVGSMERPRRVEIFELDNSNKSKLMMRLQDPETFTTIGAVSIFHPTLPAVVAANSSGYLHLFM